MISVNFFGAFYEFRAYVTVILFSEHENFREKMRTFSFVFRKLFAKMNCAKKCEKNAKFREKKTPRKLEQLIVQKTCGLLCSESSALEVVLYHT